MDRINRYVDEVLSFIIADNKTKERIRKTLSCSSAKPRARKTLTACWPGWAIPGSCARFMDSIYEDKSELLNELLPNLSENAKYLEPAYEYRSKTTIFGLPLVHIKFNRYGRPALAKGIIAIGTVSLGVVSIGAIPIGIISIGALAVGLISLGAVALGLLMALGSVAVGAVAFGGVALGLGAIGGVCLGKIAIGGVAAGTVAIGNEIDGEYMLRIGQAGPEAVTEAAALIRAAFPKLPDWIVDLFSGLVKYFPGS